MGGDKIENKFSLIFKYRNFKVFDTQEVLKKFKQIHSTLTKEFLFKKIKEVLDIVDLQIKKENFNLVIESENSNLKFPLEVRRDEQDLNIFNIFLFAILDKTVHTKNTESEMIEFVENMCKEEGLDSKRAFYRFDNDKGLENWAYGFSFFEEGVIYTCYDIIEVE